MFVGPYLPSVPNSPCKVNLPWGTEATGLISGVTVTDPSGGNLGLVALTTAAAIETSDIGPSFMAGLQLPFCSAISALTSALGDGTLAGDAGAKALKLYQDGAWQTVAAGLVSIDGDIVTYDDEPVSH